MRTVAEHRALVAQLLNHIHDDLCAEAESLHVSASMIAKDPRQFIGRRVVADVINPIDLPPFTCSQMDGYAVRSADIAQASSDRPSVLTVSAMIPAGEPPVAHQPGLAAPIMTGAPLPHGADAVVQVEQALPDRFVSAGTQVGFPEPAAPGQFVRDAGSDSKAGQLLISAGSRLTSAHLAALASCGMNQVRVARIPRVAVVSTGAELTDPGIPLQPAHIYDANLVTLSSLLTQDGCEVIPLPLYSDDPAVLSHGLSRLPAVDLIITAGGVSAGAYEVVKQAFSQTDVTFGSVAMQPGGPQGAGTLRFGDRDLPVLCFPGNPVSVLVSYEIFLREVIRSWTGYRPSRRVSCRATLRAPLRSPEHKHQVLRGRYHRGDEHQVEGTVEIVGGPGSHLLATYTGANALVHIPVGCSQRGAGDQVEVWLLDTADNDTVRTDTLES